MSWLSLFLFLFIFFFFQAEDGIRDLVRSRGLGDVYKRQPRHSAPGDGSRVVDAWRVVPTRGVCVGDGCVPDRWCRSLGAPVSYTHLTLPTSDLV